MVIRHTDFIWQNGEMRRWDEAVVHVLTHALHYGSSVFEGIRVYDTPSGPSFFRLDAHLRRLFDSARLYRMRVRWSQDDLAQACRSVVRDNKLSSAYVRPLLFRGYDTLGLHADLDQPVEAIVAAVEWPTYLGSKGLENGVDVCVSSWSRVAPNTIPALSKAGGNYLSGQLVTMEAKRNGYDEGIALTPDGTVGEGAGMNLFVVRDGEILTPPSAGSILAGITRDSVMRLAADRGHRVVEQVVPREMLYLADELFFTGTATEVTPIRSVDRLPVGDGRRGPITSEIQSDFFGLFSGETEDRHGWLDPV